MLAELTFAIEPEDEGLRLDVYLAQQDDPPLTRSQVRRCLDRGEVRVNGRQVKSGYALRGGDVVHWHYAPPTLPSLTPQDLALPVLYEDADVAIVDKPAGMVVHPSAGHAEGTLVNAILYHFGQVSQSGHALRPGIVHRIDKDTSGALAVTKSDAAHQHLGELFRTHAIARTYHALVAGARLEDMGTFRTLHGRDPVHRLRFSGKVREGRHAVTHFRVLERFHHGACLVECRLETGRTHQIRMHFFEAGAPLLGDALYGTSASATTPLIGRQALHALTLGFVGRDGARVEARAAYPEDFARALEMLRAGRNWRG